MHEPPGKFAPLRVGDIVQLARESPLAWLVSPLYATVLPILARTDATTAVTEVRGHFSRANPQHAELEDNPRATILLMGPNSYMSPSWLSDRTQAPTWMYAAVRFSVEIELIADSAGIERHLGELVKAMEHGRPRRWSQAEMGERFARLSRGVVAFKGRVLDARATFKLGQDERDDVYADIIAALEGPASLLDWMARYNAFRRATAD